MKAKCLFLLNTVGFQHSAAPVSRVCKACGCGCGELGGCMWETNFPGCLQYARLFARLQALLAHRCAQPASILMAPRQIQLEHTSPASTLPKAKNILRSEVFLSVTRPPTVPTTCLWSMSRLRLPFFHHDKNFTKPVPPWNTGSVVFGVLRLWPLVFGFRINVLLLLLKWEACFSINNMMSSVLTCPSSFNHGPCLHF